MVKIIGVEPGSRASRAGILAGDTLISINGNEIIFDTEIYDSEANLCTKIEYPADVIEGALKVLSWDFKNADKTDG